ncbi:MAG: type II toxin-antitoxin system RelE/ParE family toxin [Planctomycetia bacterium]|nr:type II toxin-antitoxin system RelE/ParE family toxin [Planctomycetia bacterium]
MATRLRFAAEVPADIAAAFAWYERQRPGLGCQFGDCVVACFEKICRQPLSYERVQGDYRRALLRRFPYAVFFMVAQDSITVFGVIHTARDPAKWQERLGPPPSP